MLLLLGRKKIRIILTRIDSPHEIHPVWTCHKYENLACYCCCPNSGKRYQKDKNPFQWLSHSVLNCVCVMIGHSGLSQTLKVMGSDTDTASEAEQHGK